MSTLTGQSSESGFIDDDLTLRMESVYIQSKYIAQIWVHGSSLKSSTVAVVVPDEPSVKFWADGRGLPSGSLSVLCNNKELKVDNTFSYLEETSGLK